MEEITFRPIGKIRSEFDKPEGTPIQPPGAEGVEAGLNYCQSMKRV